MSFVIARRLVELGAQLLGRRDERQPFLPQLGRPDDDRTRVAAVRPRRQPPTRCEQLDVQTVEHAGVDLGEPRRADVGDHVVAHVALVRVERRRAHRVLDRSEPFDEVLAERLLRRLDVLASIELREQVDARLLRLALRAEPRVPLLATPAGERIWVEFDLDVVPIALLHHRTAHRYSSSSAGTGSGISALSSSRLIASIRRRNSCASLPPSGSPFRCDIDSR